MADRTMELLWLAVQAAFAGGKAILKVYGKKTFHTRLKKDFSPVTEADLAAHGIIARQLGQTSIPLLSEEGEETPYEVRKHWKEFWLIDPLDGTKEFIRRKDEFTVNIAMIEGQAPVMGVIYAPCLDLMYLAAPRTGAHRIQRYSAVDESIRNPEELLEHTEKLPVPKARRAYTAVATRSHKNHRTSLFIKVLKRDHPDLRLISKGSSLKFCLMAEGGADIYPRFGRTMEWDTAAGDAIARASGCQVRLHDSEEGLSYNKEDLGNPWFIVLRKP